MNETFPGGPDEPGTYPVFSDAEAEYEAERKRLDAVEAAFGDYRGNAVLTFCDGGFASIVDAE